MSTEIDAKQGRRRRRTQEETAADEAEETEMVEADEDDEEYSESYTAPKGRPTAGRRNKSSSEVAQQGGTVRQGWLAGPLNYITEVREELRKVTWPTREEATRLFRIVLMVTFAASLVLGLISVGFTFLFAQGIASPIVFLIFFVAVGVAGFFFYRSFQGSRSQERDYPDRL